MKPTFEHDDFAVFDDFLPRATLADLWRYMHRERYESLARRRATLFGLLDGNVLVGPSAISDQIAEQGSTDVYPTGRRVDAVIEAMLAAEPRLEPWTGVRRDAWDYFTCSPYVYPVGAGMSWHHDSSMRSASYILYAHPAWRSGWGGELLISAADRDVTQGTADEKERRLTEFGTGHFVMPLPNRLVIMRSGVLHAISKVDVSAGDHVRASFAGFFQRDLPHGQVAK